MLHLHGRPSTRDQLGDISIVGLRVFIVSLGHDGHGGAVQNRVAPHQPQQRRLRADPAELEGALPQLPGCVLPA